MRRRSLLAGLPAIAAFPASGLAQSVPAPQLAFREILRRYYERARNETNGLVFVEMEKERDVELQRALGGFAFTGWRWTVAEVTAAASDLAFYAFNDPALVDYRLVRASFSGIVKEGTLIYSRLKLLKVNDTVTVSGRFQESSTGGFKTNEPASSRRPYGAERAKFSLPSFYVVVTTIV